MTARAGRRGDAQARLGQALLSHGSAAGVVVAIEACRSRPWSSATFEGVQLALTLNAAPADAARAWLETLAEAELPMRGHVAMPPALDGVVPWGDGLRVEMTVLVLVDG